MSDEQEMQIDNGTRHTHGACNPPLRLLWEMDVLVRTVGASQCGNLRAGHDDEEPVAVLMPVLVAPVIRTLAPVFGIAMSFSANTQ